MNEIIDLVGNDFEFKVALEHITEHVVNKNFYYKSAYSIAKNSNIKENFENQNQRRSYYLESNFNNCNLKGSGFTDSIFKETTFNGCVFDQSNFESSYFFNCDFEKNQSFFSMSFAKSFMFNAKFKDIFFNHCRLSNMIFYNSEIEGCKFDNTSFDETAFNDTFLDGVSFENLNLEYTQFNNVHINNTALPFPTIPFIINGISYLMHTSDNVTIKSAKKKEISKNEYLHLLTYLKTYYERTQHFFPLANIYIAENNVKKSFEAIQCGISQAIFLNNYRQLKNYCILASSCNLFNVHQRKSIINFMSKEFNNRLLDNFVFYSSIVSHFTELSNILISSGNSSLIVSFKTNIKNDNYLVLSLFYKTIDLLLGVVGIESNYSVDFTYNSEAEIIATINSIDPSVIVALITALTTIFIAGIKGIAHLPDVIHKFATIKQRILEDQNAVKNKQLENKRIQLEIAKLEKEIDLNNVEAGPIDQLISGIEPILMNCDELRNAGVCVNDINYNAINLNASSLTTYTRDLIFNNTSVNDDQTDRLC